MQEKKELCVTGGYETTADKILEAIERKEYRPALHARIKKYNEYVRECGLAAPLEYTMSNEELKQTILANSLSD